MRVLFQLGEASKHFTSQQLVDFEKRIVEDCKGLSYANAACDSCGLPYTYVVFAFQTRNGQWKLRSREEFCCHEFEWTLAVEHNQYMEESTYRSLYHHFWQRPNED
ncbi:MAG: hypothetical protein KDA84_10245 [Planctomycetaceae bacterium]|nr:hypothetical protein [Planctomycetaceae bacterium]